jgi:hypothetical protein
MPFHICYTQLKYMQGFLSGKREFTPSQIERIANILDNLGQVFFAVMILTPVIHGIDKTNLWVLVLGSIDVIVCWAGSIILSRRKDGR